MPLHSTHMKRIVAKEFLLLVGCVVVVLLVALVGWTRNVWLSQRIHNIRSEHAEQLMVLDSLRAETDSVSLNFIELFDTAFVHGHPDVFIGQRPLHIGSGSYSMDDLLSDFSRIYLACLFNTLRETGYYSQSRMEELTVASRMKSRMANPILKEARRNWAGLEEPPIEVKTPDGIVIGFPSSMGRIDMADVMGMLYANPTKGRPRNLLHRESHDPRRSSSAVLLDALLLNEHQGLGEIVSAAYSTVGDSVSYQMALAFSKTVMHESPAHENLRNAYDHLAQRNVLICAFDELLYTLQRKPVPPTQEALDALATQRATVDELRKEENDARTSLWSGAKQWAVVKWAAIVLLVLVYPLRLLVLGTRWALRTLRS